MANLRQLLKRIALCVAVVVVSPLIIVAKLEQWLSRSESESWFGSCGMILSLVPGKVGNYLRLGYYRFTLQGCSPDACFGFGVLMAHRAAEVGHRVVIGPRSILGIVTLGDDVLIGSRASIFGGGHEHDVSDLSRNITERPPVFERASVGPNTFIGEGAIVLADVGTRCVVAAGAVVFRSVPDFKLAVGNPARAVFRDVGSGATDYQPA